MRGKLTDQDLTNYTLNELDPGQRLYVESMLAVSVECRNDIYEMLEVARMLEDGFEREAHRVPASLTSEQRTRLTQPRRRRAAFALLHKTAATLAVAACVAFAVANPQLWENKNKVGNVTTQVKNYVVQTVAPSAESVDISSYVNLESWAEDSSDWVRAGIEALPQPTVVCTPPSWLENSDFSDFH